MNISNMLPSELIRVAVYDLTLCEKDSKYSINMATWHHPRRSMGGECQVCLVGAVMAKSLNMNRTHRGNPCDYPLEISLKLRAVDFFRQGEVARGMHYYVKSLGDNIIPHVMFENTDMFEDTDITPYSMDQSEFKQDMYDLADALEKEGY